MDPILQGCMTADENQSKRNMLDAQAALREKMESEAQKRVRMVAEGWTTTINVPVGEGEMRRNCLVYFKHEIPGDPTSIVFAPLPPEVEREYSVRIVPCPILMPIEAPESGFETKLMELVRKYGDACYGSGQMNKDSGYDLNCILDQIRDMLNGRQQ